jgi:hypothetical protein
MVPYRTQMLPEPVNSLNPCLLVLVRGELSAHIKQQLRIYSYIWTPTTFSSREYKERTRKSMEQNPSSEADSRSPEGIWVAELLLVFREELFSMELVILPLTAVVTYSINYLTFIYAAVFIEVKIGKPKVTLWSI